MNHQKENEDEEKNFFRIFTNEKLTFSFAISYTI